ncbi:MAG TPA: hypothetical protein VE575_01630 [Acidimicrobiales bacterium]|nr:hypothetical protein [Acidimicrobiales bacterium]
MRRAIFAGLALGIVAGLLFVFHDAVKLSVAWPVVLGLALWEAVGVAGARGAMTALAGAIGVGLGYATFGLVTEYLPLTDAWLGISVGVAVGVLVLAGILLKGRLPMAALLLGFAAFAGMFEPLWAESTTAFRVHGFETVTVALLGLFAGILAATATRALGDRVESVSDIPPHEKETPAGAKADGVVHKPAPAGGGAR